MITLTREHQNAQRAGELNYFRQTLGFWATLFIIAVFIKIKFWGLGGVKMPVYIPVDYGEQFAKYKTFPEYDEEAAKKKLSEWLKKLWEDKPEKVV